MADTLLGSFSRVALRAVWALRGNAHTFDPRFAQAFRPFLCEQRISIMNKTPSPSQHSVNRIRKVACNLLHPGAIRVNAYSGNSHCARFDLHHEEHHVPNRSDNA